MSMQTELDPRLEFDRADRILTLRDGHLVEGF